MSGFTQQTTLHPGYFASRYYPLLSGASPANAAPTAIDIIYLHPFLLVRPFKFSSGSVRVGTGGAGSSVKGAIWANNPLSGTAPSRPIGAPLYKDDTGAATTSSNIWPLLAFGTATLGAGVYWFGSKYTGTLPTIFSTPAQDNFSAYISGIAAASAPSANQMSFADAYANAMPTFADGAAFTVANAACPIGFLLAA